MIACVRLPHFAASCEERAHPDLEGQPFVLVDAATQETEAVSQQAAKAGIGAGMSLSQARALCADLLIRPAVHSRYESALHALLDALTVFTPQLEVEEGLELRADRRRSRAAPYLHPSQLDDPPAVTCYLDLGPLKSGDALDLGKQMHRFIGEQAGVRAKLGLSSGKFPSRVAATAVGPGDLLLVEEGGEADFLAGFTAALLPVDGEILRQLDLLGLYTMGALAAQPIGALVDRFGKLGRTMHRLASGRDTSPVQRYKAPVMAQVSRQLEGAIADWERLSAVLGEMVEAAAADLLQQGQTVQRVALVLTPEDGVALEQQMVLRQPTGNRRRLQETVLELAQSLTVRSGIAEIDLTLSDIAPAKPRQLSLFDRPAVTQEHLNTVLQDLVTRYGDAHFYWARAVTRDARLPERRYRWEKVGRSE